MIDQQHKITRTTEDGKRAWRLWYFMVLLMHVFVILLITWFTRLFHPGF